MSHDDAPTVPDNSPSDAAPTLETGIDFQGSGAFGTEASAIVAEKPGASIGPYKLLQLIGEGGFGSVFLAEQERPVRRQVALKVIKLGMDTRQVIARFEQERQVLALMDHPNIAKVFDAGATDTGRPYFVMELCRGESITDYCDTQRLSVTQRLELFAQVCLAVQHAHTKGIIHRDIKPSNVLVQTQDGRPHLKVIDFGIAKATASKLTAETLFTGLSQMIGTPEYMSPEQAEGSSDIDTRTDVYALGVLLYELLTGATPFDSKRLRSAAYAEIARIIREVDPLSPSDRLSENSDTIASVAATRHTEPKKLGTIIRGELDWIVMKALEKDRDRRYETANGLAMDIHRYLSGEAVMAAPVSRAYRFRKFVRRNKTIVSATSAVILALTMGVVAFAWQANVARKQRDIAIAAQRAEAEQRDRAVKAEKDTKIRADELEQVSNFQAGMLQQIDPTAAGDALTRDVTERFTAALAEQKPPVSAADRSAAVAAFKTQWNRVNATDAARSLIDQTILKPAIDTINAKFKDQPVVDARLRQVLAARYQALGMFDSALPLQQSALATRRRILGDDHPDTLTSINNFGSLLEDLGKTAEAEVILREAVEKSRKVLGKDDDRTLSTIGNLGNLLRTEGKYDAAEPLLRDRVERSRRVLGADHPDTLTALNALGYWYIDQGKLAEAEPLWREAYETGCKKLGEDDPEVLTWMSNLAGLLSDIGKFSEADALQREAVAKCRRIRGEDHPTTIGMIAALGMLLETEEKFTDAEGMLREAIEKSRRTLGTDHPDTAIYIANLSHDLSLQHRPADAEPYSREALAIRRRVLGDEHADTLISLHNTGCLLSDLGRLDEADTFLRDALEKRRRVLPPGNPDTRSTLHELATLMDTRDKPADAERLWREALELETKTSPQSIRIVIGIRLRLGSALAAQKKFDEAETLLLGGYENLTSIKDIPQDRLRQAAERVVKLYEAWDTADPGKGHGEKAAQWKSKLN